VKGDMPPKFENSIKLSEGLVNIKSMSMNKQEGMIAIAGIYPYKIIEKSLQHHSGFGDGTGPNLIFSQ
jgi:hypothetical protein